MDWLGVIAWGLLATLVMTAMMAAAPPLGLSRVSLPFILGTAFTPDRALAGIIGLGVHVINGWIAAFLYAFAFERFHEAHWWLGAILGALHGGLVLVVLLPLLPGMHPRMASEWRGPEPTRELEPPGFMGLHYGRWTPAIIIVAHIVYGTILGALYVPVTR